MNEELGFSGRDRDREIESTYTYMHTHTKRKNHSTFYFPESFQNTFDLLHTILKREGSNFSQWTRDNAESYVRVHEPGNPQQRLDTILRLGKAYHAPSRICGFKDCMRDSVTVGVFLQNGKEYGLCKKHLQEAKDCGRSWKFL